jgi:hypothetical protein
MTILAGEADFFPSPVLLFGSLFRRFFTSRGPSHFLIGV